MTPREFKATVEFEGWPIEGESLSERIRFIIETHPTHSIRVRSVAVEEVVDEPSEPTWDDPEDKQDEPRASRSPSTIVPESSGPDPAPLYSHPGEGEDRAAPGFIEEPEGRFIRALFEHAAEIPAGFVVKAARVIAAELAKDSPAPMPALFSGAWSAWQRVGLNWWSNRILHTFGVSLAFAAEKDDAPPLYVYPMRTSWIGFDHKTNGEMQGVFSEFVEAGEFRRNELLVGLPHFDCPGCSKVTRHFERGETGTVCMIHGYGPS
jgi:hypothetical protein